MSGYQLTAIIEREGNLFVAHCLEFDIASRGPSRASALANLKETVASFVANANDSELLRRLKRDVEVTLFDIECNEVQASRRSGAVLAWRIGTAGLP
jgi:predicted RNase H-like HicB family nuclease